jgi:hypothetical protein
LIGNRKDDVTIWEPPEADQGVAGSVERQIVTNITDRTTLRQILRNLERRSSQESMEKGIWILYLASNS